MLTVKNPVKKSFYRKKKQLIFWQLFLFSIKMMSKLSQNWLLSSALRALVSITLQKYIELLSISSRLDKFLYCLKNEQWFLPFSYPLFQVHFPTDSQSHSLSHLNIISLFIIYSFFNNFTFSNIFLFNTLLL